MLKYRLVSTPSSISKIALLIFAILSALVVLFIWPFTWLSCIFLVIYLLAFALMLRHLEERPFQCEVSDQGDIELIQPEKLTGLVSRRSFFNSWIMMLCIEVERESFALLPEKHKQTRHWFVVFSDNFPEKYYRFLARIIRQQQHS